MSLDEFHPYFLGPYGENADVLEDLLTDFVRDHVYWRRNFHPESRPPIPASAQNRDDYANFVARTRQELFSLSADLKKSVPWYSPRYVGHMASDLLLPGLIANLITTLYNPNNVTEEAAPVTVDKEIEVGFQLAEMFGFPTDPGESPCAWGHLTSGGTVANYEGLRNLSAVMFYPLALARAVDQLDEDLPVDAPTDRPLTAHSDWELTNLPIETVVDLRRRYLRAAAARGEDVARRLEAAIDRERIETKGTVEFFRDHPDLEPPVVLAPSTAHYSWPKAMKVLELGSANLVQVGVDADMRIRPDALAERLDELAQARRPVLAVVAVMGTTEFGTVDPLGEIVEERERRREEGLYFPIHADAAWGGYLTSIFRAPDGSLVDRSTLRDDFRHFPSWTVYNAFDALSEVDSVTVDPHKLGYIPYPAGAYVARSDGLLQFVSEGASYVFGDSGELESQPLRDQLKKLGQFILEGSKPGAAAASVHVSHRVLPLHNEAFGQLLKETVRATEYFYDRVEALDRALGDRVTIEIPFEPDTNVLCVAVSPEEITTAARQNEFVESVYEEMRIDPTRPIQTKSFFTSSTALHASKMSDRHIDTLTRDLGLDPETLCEFPDDPRREADHLLLLRNTLMNPWLRFEEEGKNYIDRYLEFLRDRILERLD
ncbi:MAG: aspartate aminotransferase family protein [Bradymonadaceae bacterium]